MPLAALGLAVAVVVAAGLVFVLARWLGWTHGWIYVGILVATILINSVCLLRWNPGLIRSRMRIGKGTKTYFQTTPEEPGAYPSYFWGGTDSPVGEIRN